ncbi:MAG TPA: glutaminase [Saprospiraceae bacterium]|nr:glutaminase [Saprospiraceae bacterium]
MQQILEDILNDIKNEPNTGSIATYIPELAKIDPNKFGLHLKFLNGSAYFVGDSMETFSIQSISKVFATALLFSKIDDKMWDRVGKEPSGNPFNSLVQLEYEKGIPRNPLINSGAIVVADMLVDILQDPKGDFLNFIRYLSSDHTIDYNMSVFESEKNTGFRNVALANFIKSFGNIHNDVNEVLDFYFLMCSVAMSCQQLAESFLLFANHGVHPVTNEAIMTVSQTKRMNALMQTCGFYDEAGDFTFKVGLPGKSGVGGGIVAILPKKYSVAVWSPKLNEKGNSEAGMKALELLTTKTGYSIF